MVKTFKIFIIISISIVFNAKSQENNTILSDYKKDIQNNNYYNYYVKNSTTSIITNWLKHDEAIPVITSEIKSFGYKVENYKLYEIEKDKQIVLDVYLPDQNLGILFNEGHAYPIKKTQRNIKIYRLYRYELSGNLVCDRFKTFPDNILVLQETWYWYQYMKKDNGDVHLLDKNTAIKILKEDIKSFIENYKDKN